MTLRELYQEIIVDHGKSPRNFGKLDAANHQQLGHNPLCGDELWVYVLETEGVITDIRFEGTGCAISMASASLMTETIKGKTVAEIETLFQQFHRVVTVGDAVIEGKLAVFCGIVAFPVRVKCATLAWHTLKAALADANQTTCTE